MSENKAILTFTKGGAGSGHHGHSGRPGKRGGSAPGGGSGGGTTSVPTTTMELHPHDKAEIMQFYNREGAYGQMLKYSPMSKNEVSQWADRPRLEKLQDRGMVKALSKGKWGLTRAGRKMAKKLYQEEEPERLLEFD